MFVNIWILIYLRQNFVKIKKVLGLCIYAFKCMIVHVKCDMDQTFCKNILSCLKKKRLANRINKVESIQKNIKYPFQ